MLTDYCNFCSAIFSREFLNKNELNFSSHLNYVATLPCETTLFNLDVRSHQYVSWDQNDEQVAAQLGLKNEWIIETITVKAGAQNVLRVHGRRPAVVVATVPQPRRCVLGRAKSALSSTATLAFNRASVIDLPYQFFQTNETKWVSNIYSEIQSCCMMSRGLLFSRHGVVILMTLFRKAL